MREKNSKKIIVIFISILTVLGFFGSILTVKATNYQFLDNAGFEDAIGGNLITTGNFESGLSDGLNASGASIVSATGLLTAKSPTHFGQLPSAGNYFMYHFSSAIPVSSIASIGLWFNYSSGFTARLTVFYTGGGNTYQDYSYITPFKSWKYNDFLNNPTANLTLVEGDSVTDIQIKYQTNAGYIDDWTLVTNQYGQQHITTTTTPWYINGYADSIQQLGDINNTFGHSGNCSFQDSLGYNVVAPLTGISTTSSFPFTVWQDLPNGVYSQNVTDFSMWARTEDTNPYQVKAYIIYSDGASSEKLISFFSYNQWTLLNFTSALLPNKIVTKIGFKMIGGTIAINTGDHGGHYYLYIDDVSFLTNVPETQTTITWSLTPQPLSWNTNAQSSFTQLTGVAETVVYYIYDFNGVLSENGTATITTSYGTLNTTVTLGVFSFSLSARPTGGNSTEFLTSQIILNTRTIVHVITASWVTLSQSTSTPSTGIDENTVTQGSNTVVYLGGGLLIVLALSLTFGAIAGKDGLLTGVVIGTFLASITGLFPIYGLIFAVIVGAILVVSHTGIPNTSGGNA